MVIGLPAGGSKLAGVREPFHARQQFTRLGAQGFGARAVKPDAAPDFTNSASPVMRAACPTNGSRPTG